MFRTKLALIVTLVTLITTGAGCITDDTDAIDPEPEPDVVAAPPLGGPRAPGDETSDPDCRVNNKPSDRCDIPE